MASRGGYEALIFSRFLGMSPMGDNSRERSDAMSIAKNVFRTGTEDAKTAGTVFQSGLEDALFAECPHALPSDMMTWARKTGLVQAKKRNPTLHYAARERVRVKVENGDPVSRDALAQELNVSEGAIQRANLVERGRLEGIAEGEANVLNAQGKFTKVQARHVEALIKKLERHLHSTFNAAVEARVNQQVADRKAALDAAREACNEQKNKAFKEEQYWHKLINNRKPIFTLEEFRAIVIALHPDNSASPEMRARALQSVTEKRLPLTGKP